jgi:hypothetical protein
VVRAVRFGRGPGETDWSQDRHRAPGPPHHVNIRDGQVANRPIYAAIGVTLTGDKDIRAAGNGRSARQLAWIFDAPGQPQAMGTQG